MKKNNILSIFAFLLISAGLYAQVPFVQWNFNNDDTNTSIGSGAITLVGGTTNTFASGAGSSDTAATNRGFNTSTYAALGTENKQRGIQINASTTGYSDIILSFDQRLSNTANNTYTVQYTTNVTASTVVWVDMQTLTLVPAETGVGDTWHNQRTVSFSSVTALNNNENAAFRIVSAFDPETNDYRAARSTSNYGTAGTVRFDMITLSGTTQSATPSLVVTPSTLTFSQTVGTPSVSQSVSVIGTNLTEAIALSVTAPFEISLTEEGTYAGTQSLSLTDGGFSGNVFVRLNATEANTFTGTLTAQTTGITPNIEVALNGEATSPVVLEISDPTPFILSTGNYSFTEWAATSEAGTYPNNMMLWINSAGDGIESTIEDEYVQNWECGYEVDSASRFLGEGTNGLAFLNTGNTVTNANCYGTSEEGRIIGKPGAVVLALNTLGRENIVVNWTGRTLIPNNRVYAIRLQYRIGNGDGNPNLGWTNFETVSEYLRNTEEGHSEALNVNLPETLNNQELVQLRWVYFQHESNTNTGSRAKLALDEVLVSSEETASVGGFDTNNFRIYPNPATSVVNFNKEITATIFDITGKKVLSFENTTSVNVTGLNKGIYVVKTTDGTVKKLIVK